MDEIVQTVLMKYIIPIVGLIISALVARYLIPWLKKKEKEADTDLKKKLLQMAAAIVEQKNSVLEKAGHAKHDMMSGTTKKENALAEAAKLLGDHKLKMTPEAMENMLEAVLGEPKILNSAKK
jgi:phosphate/sulfate permease